MKLGIVVGLSLLLAPRLACAGTALVTWQYPLSWQAGTAYILSITTLRNGVPRATTQALALLPLQECRRQPETVITPETLCSRICLDPGDYTASLVASHAGETSAPSNVFDLEITSGASCQVATGVPPVPTKPVPVAPAVIGAAGVVGTVAGGNGTGPAPPSWTSLVNLACVSWKITGVCACGFPPHPCVTVEYFEPGWLVEVVKKPGDTIMPVLGALLGDVLQAVGIPAFGGGGAGNASGSGHTNLFYGEVHAYTFPQLLGGPCTACAPSAIPFTLHYASEIDAASWRTVAAVPSPLDLLQQVGVWGHLYPRGGKVIHSSEPVASALEAVRGMDIAHQPIGTPPNVDAHIVTQITEERASCIQMAWPTIRGCMPPGTPPVLWESGTLSPTGKYAFLFWRKRTCCVDPEQTTCGITLAGSSGQNICVLPPLP